MTTGSVKPKKWLGQHFLRATHHAERLAASLSPVDGETILEVGPGMGVLTEYLVRHGNPVVAYEIDSESVNYLAHQMTHPNLTVLEQDFLTAPLPVGNLLLAGNLPYNISSSIFFRIFEEQARIRQAAVMVQREVAERICAGPGSKTYGILSVLLGHYYDCRYLATLKPGCFQPPPKVDSALLLLDRRIDRPAVHSPERFRQVVKAAFNQRRKTVANALKVIGFEVPAEWATYRAEAIPIDVFAAWANLPPTGY
jgi:16S rRNA (adenine1518-N6/adenine1519-N6)-dimethyltransferase